MWVTFYSTLRRFVVSRVLYSSHVPKPKVIIASLARWDRKSKDIAHLLRADQKFVIPNLSHHFVPMHPSHFWFWSGSDWIDEKSALRQICSLNLCLNFVWRLVNFIQAVGSPSGLFHIIVSYEIGKNPLVYMKAKIPSLQGWDNNQRMWTICIVAPSKHYVRSNVA